MHASFFIPWTRAINHSDQQVVYSGAWWHQLWWEQQVKAVIIRLVARRWLGFQVDSGCASTGACVKLVPINLGVESNMACIFTQMCICISTNGCLGWFKGIILLGNTNAQYISHILLEVHLQNLSVGIRWHPLANSCVCESKPCGEHSKNIAKRMLFVDMFISLSWWYLRFIQPHPWCLLLFFFDPSPVLIICVASCCSYSLADQLNISDWPAY